MSSLSFSRIILPAFILLNFLILPARSSAELIDRVVAVVNNEVITSTELDATWNPIRRQLRKKIPADKLEATLAAEKKKVLDNLIDNLLISQEAESMKISVSEKEIDETVERVAENNRLSVEELHKELERTGIDLDTYRKNIFNNIQRSKLISRKITSKIVISEEKIKEYYETIFTAKNTAEGYHILQIGFTWGKADSASVSRDEAEQRAEKIRKLVSEGQNFRELSRSFSELPSAEDGGDLGIFKADEMSGSMRKVLVGLEPGEVSDVVEMSDSFQFYMILSENLNGTTRYAPYEVFRSELSEILYNQEQKKRYDNWMNEIRDRSYIKLL